MAKAKEPASTTESTSVAKPATAVMSPTETVSLPELNPGLIAAIVGGYHPQPHATLGQHAVDGGFVIRAVRPLAESVTATRVDGTVVTLDHVAEGLWQGFAAGAGQAYTLTAAYDGGTDWVTDDPYRLCRRSARWISFSGVRVATSSCGMPWAPTFVRMRTSSVPRSACGLPTRRPLE